MSIEWVCKVLVFFSFCISNIASVFVWLFWDFFFLGLFIMLTVLRRFSYFSVYTFETVYSIPQQGNKNNTYAVNLINWRTNSICVSVVQGQDHGWIRRSKTGSTETRSKKPRCVGKGGRRGMEAGWSSFEGHFLILSMLTCTFKVEPQFL